MCQLLVSYFPQTIKHSATRAALSILTKKRCYILHSAFNRLPKYDLELVHSNTSPLLECGDPFGYECVYHLVLTKGFDH
ncbi:hypothetical protein BUH_4827 [Burkholderia pseudomallei Pakistan 9]|nr:hypothetical protein BUH_4827 [Burkholderia pseudomallei Pakistan 9]